MLIRLSDCHHLLSLVGVDIMQFTRPSESLGTVCGLSVTMDTRGSEYS